MGNERLHAEEVVAEFEGSDLGDARLDRRLVRVAGQLARSPTSSFPALMETVADREALYRFLGNEQVTLEGILAPHVRQTSRRISGPLVRVVHDTTSLSFGGNRDGLGSIQFRPHGFFTHCALAVDETEQRRPLGVVAVSTFALTEAKARRHETPKEKVQRCHRTPRDEKLSSRWEKLAVAASATLPPDVEAIHIMDQEADDFAMLASLVESGLRFVVRGAGSRLTADVGASIRDAVGAQDAHLFRTVRLSRRRTRTVGRRPGRDERQAELSIRWAPVELRRPNRGQTETRSLNLNVVHVFEKAPPRGEPRVEWFLLTSERVTTVSEATTIVDHYRARWIIEEFFKALKTGCAIEKRQLSTYESLVRALGLFIPIAWQLLSLRTLAADSPDAPASAIFDDEDIAVLRVLLKKRKPDVRFDGAPTVRAAMLAIAALGGHIPNNGDPGWIVLGRGFQTYTDAREVWRAARCDQS